MHWRFIPNTAAYLKCWRNSRSEEGESSLRRIARVGEFFSERRTTVQRRRIRAKQARGVSSGGSARPSCLPRARNPFAAQRTLCPAVLRPRSPFAARFPLGEIFQEDHRRRTLRASSGAGSHLTWPTLTPRPVSRMMPATSLNAAPDGKERERRTQEERVGGEEEIREGAVSSAGRQEWVSRAESQLLAKYARTRAHVHTR